MKRKTLNQWTRHGLLRLPVRKWDKTTFYDSLLVLSTGRQHDSGWAVMAIIGVRNFRPVEIAACSCDDVEWKLPAMVSFDSTSYESGRKFTIGQMRMDCCLESGAVHFWQNDRKFRVGTALSTVVVELL